MLWLRTVSFLACSLACAAAGPAAWGAQSRSSSTREAFYRCQDASGQTHYADRMPVACRGQDTDVLNDQGALIRVIEGEKTRAERLAREQSEKAARVELERRQQRDRMLIDTYLNVEDIERLRDQRLDLLEAQYKITEQNIANLRERQERLESQVARFKPYNDKPNAPPLPDHLAEEIVNTVKSLQVYERTLIDNRAEQQQIQAAFAADIRRFKELKGIK